MQAGKTEKEYTTHFTMSKPGPGGVVVCPYLLSLECRYCHEKGHTPKYCPKLKTNNRFNTEINNEKTTTQMNFKNTNIKKEIVNENISPKKSVNKFACLELDNVTDDTSIKHNVINKPQKKEEFPALGGGSQFKTTKMKKKNYLYTLNNNQESSWSQIAAKPIPELPVNNTSHNESEQEELERLKKEQQRDLFKAQEMAFQIKKRVLSDTENYYDNNYDNNYENSPQDWNDYCSLFQDRMSDCGEEDTLDYDDFKDDNYYQDCDYQNFDDYQEQDYDY